MAIARQNPFQASFHKQGAAADENLFPLVGCSDSFAGRVSKLIGFNRRNGESGRARNNCFGERMFRLALRDAGSGQNLPLGKTVSRNYLANLRRSESQRAGLV